MKTIITIILTTLLTILIARAVAMSASVEESDMRRCIESCGYEFK